MECRAELARLGVHCRRCGAIAGPFEQNSGDCSRCRGERFRFDGVLALGRYEGALRDAVLRMKSRHEEPLMTAIGGLLADHFVEEIRKLDPDVVLSIPMHWTRRLRRGTNSPEQMGHVVARRLNLDFVPRAIRRARRTRQLATLTRQERKRTMRDAFAVAAGCDFGGARVLLIDDVLTTGTTCDTAARVLKKAGAAAVFVLVAARAYPGD
jgi:ComF family protein